MARNNPYGGTDLAAYLTHRVAELRPRKSQVDIALEAGYPNANMISMLKAGSTKLALDRVVDLAKALDADPARLFRMSGQFWMMRPSLILPPIRLRNSLGAAVGLKR